MMVKDCLFPDDTNVDQQKIEQAIRKIIPKPENLQQFVMGEYQKVI
jgi:translation elongation factor EF-1beta